MKTASRKKKPASVIPGTTEQQISPVLDVFHHFVGATPEVALKMAADSLGENALLHSVIRKADSCEVIASLGVAEGLSGQLENMRRELREVRAELEKLSVRSWINRVAEFLKKYAMASVIPVFLVGLIEKMEGLYGKPGIK